MRNVAFLSFNVFQAHMGWTLTGTSNQRVAPSSIIFSIFFLLLNKYSNGNAFAGCTGRFSFPLQDLAIMTSNSQSQGLQLKSLS